ncbi:anti-sigma factor [Cellulomonas sp. ACRRI]|uniref:anti-sigma factor n=1 Tax=Cellulomonas sp. ACRRI TaxID=2918188 RepID=UPI001EF320C8|nr:anti-sigma factor [Cellulomonas sp. ACRRI]MCG7284550.1 anti-sigma factor [Cellulomonas sp. ACRRI]
MPHLGSDALALHAVGEPATPAERRHLAECDRCARELAVLRSTAASARAGVGEALVPAPDAVWERISAELGLAPDVRPGPAGAASAGPQDGTRPARPGGGASAGRSRGRWLLAVAAGLVVGAVGGGAVVAAGQRPTETVVAEARLDPLPGWTASGDAWLEEGADGTRTLVVRVSRTEEDGFRAVWLLDQDATRLVSLGALDGDEGRFAVPPGLDLDEFPVVDVSAEPFDGDPAHSGDSIVRGALDRPA